MFLVLTNRYIPKTMKIFVPSSLPHRSPPPTVRPVNPKGLYLHFGLESAQKRDQQSERFSQSSNFCNFLDVIKTPEILTEAPRIIKMCVLESLGSSSP